MDLKVMASVFALVFIAELGDKTQLATFAFASAENSKISVFIGAAFALVAATALATLAGGLLSNYISTGTLHKISGVLFIAFGVFYLVR